MAADLLGFPFIGGRPALNFLATLGKRNTAPSNASAPQQT